MPTTSAIPVLQYSLGLGAVLLSGYLTAAMWKRRGKPTVRPLLLLAVVMVASATAALLTMYPPVERALTPAVWPDAAGPLWAGVLAVLVIVAAGLWFLFALQYTGRGGLLIRPAAVTVVVLWTLVFGVAIFGDSAPQSEEVQTHVEVVLSLAVFFMSILLTIGVLLVLTASLQQNAIGFREGIALSGGAVALALGPIVGNSVENAALVPATVLVASGLFVSAIRQYPVFEAPPLVRIAGRDRLIEEVNDAVVVTDLEGRIHDLNPAAEDALETDRAEALGEPLESLLPAAVEPSDLTAAEDPVEVSTGAETALAITADLITDARERSFGYLVVCRDVTERRRRERRLGVLNQLLTGAVIDRMRAVAESAATITASEREDGSRSPNGPDPSRVGTEIRKQTSDLVDLVRRTREIERALAEERAAEADTVAVVRRVAETVSRADGIELEIETDASVPPTAIDATVLETILETLLAGAVDTNRNRVSLDVVDAERYLQLRIVEDAPSTPAAGTTDAESDRAVEGEERQSLRELSIEMARLAAAHAGGDVLMRSDGAVRRIVIAVPTIEARSPDEREPVLADGSADDGPRGRSE